jgi:hypothetical protein
VATLRYRSSMRSHDLLGRTLGLLRRRPGGDHRLVGRRQRRLRGRGPAATADRRRARRRRRAGRYLRSLASSPPGLSAPAGRAGGITPDALPRAGAQPTGRRIARFAQTQITALGNLPNAVIPEPVTSSVGQDVLSGIVGPLRLAFLLLDVRQFLYLVGRCALAGSVAVF